MKYAHRPIPKIYISNLNLPIDRIAFIRFRSNTSDNMGTPHQLVTDR
jgi:hypothetical protein